MKIGALLIVLLGLVFTLQVQAQEGVPEWRLKTPTATEYLAAVPEIIASQPEDNGNVPRDVIATLENDFWLRYGDTADATTLSQAYDALAYGYNLWSNYMPYLDPADWNMRIVERWLRDNSVDLARLSQIQFDDYAIDIQPYDFKADGGQEWLMHVIREYPFEDYWVAQRDTSQESGYQLMRLPIPYRADGFWPAQQEWGGSHLERIEDLNGNGKPELVFTTAARAPASWSTAVDDYFYVVGWNKDQFEILTNQFVTGDNDRSANPGTPYALNVRTQGANFWHFENLDGDVALELVEEAEYKDNWECKRNTRRVFDWDGTYYMLVSDQNVKAESMNCALRDAQEAMWKYDYSGAALLYELALKRYAAMTPNERSISPNTETFGGYAQERLVLAYALAGHMPEARDLLEKMAIQGVPERTIAAQLIRAAADDADTFELCKTAYDYLQHYPDLYSDDDNYYRGLRSIGEVSEEFYAEVPTYYPPDARQGGCDIGQATFDIIAAHEFNTQKPLRAQLQGLGIDVTQDIHADLNLDGNDEWLMWIEGQYKPIFFVSDGNSYQVSSSDFRLPPEGSSPTMLEVHRLPDETGQAWVMWDVTTNPGESGCTDYAGVSAGGSWLHYLHIWRLQNGNLVDTQHIPICEAPTLEQLFPMDNELDGWVDKGGSYEGDPKAFFEPAIYTWDAKQQLYVLPTIETLTPTTISSQVMVATSTPPPYNRYDYFYQYETAFQKNDFATSLQIVDMMLTYSDESLTSELHYWRGLALEFLNRPDEALVEYVAIVKVAPESAWGKLARLLLECVRRCE